MVQQYGLIGFPLSHSFSPNYFNQKFAKNNITAQYESYSIEDISLLPDLLQQTPNLVGLNVTIPYKTCVIPYLDFISQEAQEIGAVNCIKLVDGQLLGFNTDHYGFSQSLKPLLSNEINSALVLGTGGSAQAIFYALKQMNLPYKIVSHSGKSDCNYSELDEEIIQEHQLIINTTPLGMYPKTDEYPPIPYEYLDSSHLLFDLIYNPELTTFLKHGAAKGALIKNGLEMLHLQAEKSWEIWNEDQDITHFISLK
ncbi:MAG: shikimate dehydrogenase [Bacteroidota bacterium]